MVMPNTIPTDSQAPVKRPRGRPCADPADVIGLPGLKRALAAAGWTQVRLAAAIDSSQPIVSSWITGKHDPPVRTARRIAQLLGVSTDQLILATPAAPAA
jgi:DNA-binding XRE family transcriptional regulator